jgi:hypothetical protein
MLTAIWLRANCMLDACDCIPLMIDFMLFTRFRLPETLILDRQRNRRLGDRQYLIS